jgi:hypothetical protein
MSLFAAEGSVDGTNRLGGSTRIGIADISELIEVVSYEPFCCNRQPGILSFESTLRITEEES